jgi:glycosyltransferase involved in cell wall biosynthesis
MATGVPLVTTRVGQAPDLVDPGRNGLLVEVGDVEAIVDSLARVRDDGALVDGLRRAGRETAEAYAYERLDGLWAALLDGFVEKDAA